MDNNEFYLKQQEALQKMREMSTQAKIKGSHTQHEQPAQPTKNNNFVKQNKEYDAAQNLLNIPFLNNLFKDSDSAIIIGLLLILLSEKSDKMLLFALVYILL